MAVQKRRKTKPKEFSREGDIFLRKMFAYAFVAIESLPPHRQDQAFLDLAHKVLVNYHSPSHLMQYVDQARERIHLEYPREHIRPRGEVVRLDDYR